MELSWWVAGDAWSQTVRGYESRVIGELARALAWRDVLAAREQCERELSDAEKRRDVAEKRMTKIAEESAKATAEVERVHRKYLIAVAANGRADKPERLEALPESEALTKAGHALSQVDRERRSVSAALYRATGEVEALTEIRRQLFAIREPDVALIREVGLWKA